MGSGRKELRHNPWIQRWLFQVSCHVVEDSISTVQHTAYLSFCRAVRLVSVLSVLFLWMFLVLWMYVGMIADSLGVSPPSSDSNQRR